MANPEFVHFIEIESVSGASTFVGPLQYGSATMRHLSSQIYKVREIMSSISSSISGATILEGVPRPAIAYVAVVSRSMYERLEHLSRAKIEQKKRSFREHERTKRVPEKDDGEG
ncbi:hypothetical protein KY285_001370 [Solanum tuberosum]|nr:hypothetical protein KY285_001370 [Solanum tuberosum]